MNIRPLLLTIFALGAPHITYAQNSLVPITASSTPTASSKATIATLPQKSVQSSYRLPVDFPVSLSGNVGEIRSNHFHSGIDIRGGANMGAPIYAVMEGYVSRIGVSPFGYGYVLYVAHPNGTTSVYAHLDSFASHIASWVRGEQYARKSFTVDLYPTKGQFSVEQGDRIASLGNSGSSGGPHLHFEIRNSAYQTPINILARGIYKIADQTAPIVSRIHLYSADTIGGHVVFNHSSSAALTTDKNSGRMVLRDSVLYASGPVYLAYEITDRKSGSSFLMGIYAVEQKVDGDVNFSYKIDELNFATTRYSNALAQYSLTTKTRNDVIRAYVSPSNRLDLYRNVKDRGLITPAAKEGDRVRVATTFTDDNGNSTTVKLAIERKTTHKPPQMLAPGEHLVDCKVSFTTTDTHMSVSIPSDALYDTHVMPIYQSGDTYHMGINDIPLQTNATLRVNAPIEPKLQSKALFLNSRGTSGGGEWKNGAMELSTRNFGAYRIGYDTIPPRIQPFATGKSSMLKFKVTDNLSGVNNYTLTVDGKWALLEYDPKNALLFYRFTRSSSPRTHDISLTITDGKGNTSQYKSTQEW